MKKIVQPDDALARLEALCARSEQCSSEVLSKMMRWGLSSDDRRRILERLVERRFVDDDRYARAYVRSKLLFNGWGRKKILMGLAAKRIDRASATDAVESEVDEEAYAGVLVKILLGRARGMERPLSHDDKMKLAKFAMQCGFEWELIKKALVNIAE